VVAHRPEVFICEVRIPGVVVFEWTTLRYSHHLVSSHLQCPLHQGRSQNLGRKKELAELVKVVAVPQMARVIP